MRSLKSPSVQIGAAAIGGILFGLLVGEWAANLRFVGDIFIRLIQMSIVPLVMTSVIVATGALSGTGMGKLAFRTFKWMLGFSFVAAVLAWGLSALIQPGAGMTFDGEVDASLADSAAQATGWQDTLLEFVSTNIFAAMSAATMVPIIVFSLVFGMALNSYVASTGNRQVLEVIDQIQHIVLTMIRFVMAIAPIGVSRSSESAMFSAAVSASNNEKCWNTIPIPSFLAALGLAIRTARPFHKISPSFGSSDPNSILTSVDFPAPFSPSSA